MITQRGFTVWFTGLSGAGKTTISNRLHHRLKKRGVTNVEVLDGDDVTMHISKGLGFTKEDTESNILRRPDEHTSVGLLAIEGSG